MHETMPAPCHDTRAIQRDDASRAKIIAFEQALAQHPEAHYGDWQEQCPLTHRFAEGCYVREIFIPKGMALTGKIHKHSHPNFLLRGEVLVYTEQGGVEHLKAPLAMISEPGTKRVVVALADTVWITVHVTSETDLARIEEEVIAPSYDAYEVYRAQLAPLPHRKELPA